MQIGILGSGMVGRAIAGKLSELGYDVVIGSRDVAALMARTESDGMGNPPFGSWLQNHPAVRVGDFREAAAQGEILFNCTNGRGALDALAQAGEAHLNNKLLIDISNPLDFSQGMPPSLFVSNNDSLGEQIQRAYPKAKVVKTLNTVNAYLMVEPTLLAAGDHTMFVSGDDVEAKAQVVNILREWFGWQDIIDLGDITTARGSEMLLPIWARLWAALGTPMFSLKVVR
ncbi:MAG: NAD(P)-binding domain-containing protein [Anaerolineales bacterium]|nr:NAD(P)-binding domain-containing protein [Anaerolineales bacterium]MCB9127905.1 NAD(P)-binding domain-containing protein [Ardenticatenales bacterium]MCB9171667.1 NAD(P)-binding domain-containing protein [Ardenticatenales bacterium]